MAHTTQALAQSDIQATEPSENGERMRFPRLFPPRELRPPGTIFRSEFSEDSFERKPISAQSGDCGSIAPCGTGVVEETSLIMSEVVAWDNRGLLIKCARHSVERRFGSQGYRSAELRSNGSCGDRVLEGERSTAIRGF
jgi:hypothetical protein